MYDPRFLPIERWSALVASALLPYGFVSNSTDEKNWRTWAGRVRQVPVVAAYHVPDPRGFVDWRDWAYQLNQSLLSLGI